MNWIAVAALLVATACMGQQDSVVRLQDNGGTWQLSNGSVELTIDKTQATLTHLALSGGPELVDLGYYDTNGGPGGFEKNAGYLRFGRHEPAEAYIAHQSDDLVDVALRTDVAQTTDWHQPLRTEFHYVLRRGEPGFYVYWLRWHEQDMRPFDLGQTRYVIKTPRAVFDRWQITDERSGAFPTDEEMAASKSVYDATIQLADGRYMTKYANAVAAADHHLSGLFSSEHKVGLWQINASNEYINGGPTKQNLTVHEETPILLHMVHSGHFGGRGIHIEGDWAKVYGPVFYYINKSATPEDAWRDARERVRTEQAAWPYPWVRLKSVPDAYALERGSVMGTVRRTDGESAAGAMAVLGAAEPEWQYQGLGCVYWSRVGDDGAFEIGKVRPGSYTLYVYQKGLFGQAERGGITVEAGAVTDEGRVELAPQAAGPLLWQVGIPDRTAAEFRHGDEFREVYLHRRYPDEFPDDVRFVIGQSVENRDWNYYQPGGKTWQVVFGLEEALQHDSTLTIALAASGYRPASQLAVKVNDQELETLQFEDGDNALWRLGIYDAYQVRQVSIPAPCMHAGENVLSLTIPSPRAWVMYDFVRLEATE